MDQYAYIPDINDPMEVSFRDCFKNISLRQTLGIGFRYQYTSISRFGYKLPGGSFTKLHPTKMCHNPLPMPTLSHFMITPSHDCDLTNHAHHIQNQSSATHFYASNPYASDNSESLLRHCAIKYCIYL